MMPLPKLLTWSGHVISWLNEPDLRVLVVRYEDIKADPIGQFTTVIRFSGLEEDLKRIEWAVEFSRFEQVQKQEQKKMPLSKSFFRRGVMGD
jgi:hypothetical protein